MMTAVKRRLHRNTLSHPLFSPILCPECGTRLRTTTDTSSHSIWTCKKCGEIQELLECPERSCKHQLCTCSRCGYNLCGDTSIRQPKRNEILPSATTCVKSDKIACFFWILIVFVLFFGVIAFLMNRGNSSETFTEIHVKLIKNLKKDFPSQRNETWHNLLSVLEKGVPTVKSITLLHGEDKRTSDCLTRKLACLYSGNNSIKNEEITFSSAGYEAMDYGFALEHYRLVVERFRVFVTDLIKVPADIARIFHSLCDDVTSDIKPSLFIFTLKYDERTEKLKPMERATAILKEIWSDLPDNEIFPLFSRIIKNVVDVVPEKETSCN